MSLSVKGTDPLVIDESADLTSKTKEAIRDHLDQVDALLTQENLHPIMLADGETLKAPVEHTDLGDDENGDEEDEDEKDDEENE